MRLRREQLKWLAEISPRHRRTLCLLLIEEANERRRQDRVQKFADVTSLFENWNPDLHPRGGYPDNLGWFSPATAAAGVNQGNHFTSEDDSFKLSSETVTALSSAVRPALRSVVAWQDPGAGIPQETAGHHWINEATTNRLMKEKLLSPAAKDAFDAATKPTRFYTHRFDTWLGVSHHEYNNAILNVTRKYIDLVSPGDKLSGEQATQLVNWIKDGFGFSEKYGIRLEVLGRLRNDDVIGPLIARARTWRKGFLQSVTLADSIWAQRKSVDLTLADIKIMCRRQINGEKHLVLSEAAQQMEKIIKSMGKKWVRILAARAPQVLMGLGALASATSGYAGTGAIPSGGVWGAFNEVARDAVLADIVEPLAKAVGQSASERVFKPEHPAENRFFREYPMLREEFFRQEGLKEMGVPKK